ncbi:MAG: hypothetical protein IJL47_01850 [Lachnospiraceae bacterium]|nr:hypothetical protein [Lachnospiraceae bacterium]
MKPKMIKDRCTKKKFTKCSEVAKLYDKIQIAYADALEEDPDISSFKCNVPLEDLEEGDFTTDFVCMKADGDYRVRECVWRKKLTLPRTAKLLDASKKYWLRHGVSDWGKIITLRDHLIILF